MNDKTSRIFRSEEVKNLVKNGREKGRLTYKEVNDALPEEVK